MNDPKTVTDKANVTETIHYVYANGPKKGQPAAPDSVQTLDFNRSGSQDPVTDKVTWDNWNDGQTFADVDSPDVQGYIVSRESVTGQTVSHDSNDIDITVYYTAQPDKPVVNQATVTETIHYLYKNGPKAGQKVTDDYTAAKHFTRVGSQSPVDGSIDWLLDWQDGQVFAQVKSPSVKGYNADKAQIDKQTVNHDSQNLEYTVYYSTQPEKDVTDSNQVTETIHYVYGNGPHKGEPAAPDYVASKDFSRTGKQSPIDNTIQWSTWNDGQTFDKVESPEIKGYVPNYQRIDQQTVNHDSTDLDYVVTYVKKDPTAVVDQDTVKMMIDYKYKADNSQAAPSNTQQVEFIRTGLQDAVSGEINWNKWSAAQKFNDIASPQLKGYNVDQPVVSGPQVNAGDDDIHVTVWYDKQAPTPVNDSKTVTETIHYVYADSGKTAAPDYTSDKTFTRTGEQDPVTDEITWNDWTPTQTFAQVVSPTIDGYTADQDQIASIKVNYGDDNIEKTVVYKKTPAPKTYTWTVKYQTTDGQTIKAPVTVGKSYQSGEDYDVTKQNSDTYPAQITKDGQTYKLVKSDNPAGQFDQQDETTILTYQAVHQVTVRYEDEQGNEIHDADVVLTDGEDGTKYDTTTVKLPTIIKNGQTYSFKEVKKSSDQETGKLNGHDVTVTYVYALKETDTPSTPDKKNPTDTPTTPDSNTPTDTSSKQDKKYTWKIRFKDTRGDVLKPTVDVDQEFASGDHFDANQYRQATITVNGKTYELVPTESTNISGDFTDHNEVSIFIYRLQPSDSTSTTPGTQTPTSTPATPNSDTSTDGSTTDIESPRTSTTTSRTNNSEPGTPSGTLAMTGNVAQSSSQITGTGAMSKGTAKSGQGQLPQTGNNDQEAASLATLGLVGTFLAGFGLGKKRRRN